VGGEPAPIRPSSAGGAVAAGDGGSSGDPWGSVAEVRRSGAGSTAGGPPVPEASSTVEDPSVRGRDSATVDPRESSSESGSENSARTAAAASPPAGSTPVRELTAVGALPSAPTSAVAPSVAGAGAG